uniref:Uncharacterized protein n=1 Tax=Ascaris lumbricoides TaxID=6252 RepID=A0A0M3IJR0_ASCLU
MGENEQQMDVDDTQHVASPATLSKEKKRFEVKLPRILVSYDSCNFRNLSTINRESLNDKEESLNDKRSTSVKAIEYLDD